MDSKNIMISQELFGLVVKRIIFEATNEAEDTKLREMLNKKIESMQRRQLFSDYRNATDPNEKRSNLNQYVACLEPVYREPTFD